MSKECRYSRDIAKLCNFRARGEIGLKLPSNGARKRGNIVRTRCLWQVPVQVVEVLLRIPRGFRDIGKVGKL
jgi:hypothetical protein